MEACKTIVLCGGKGTRMGALGGEIPKALVELHGQPMLFHKFQHGLRQDFKEYVLAIGYRGDMIREAVRRMPFEAGILFSDSGVEAGMLRRIVDAAAFVGDRAIVTYGDSIANVDFTRLLGFHRERGGLVTIVSAPIQSPFGLITSDHRDRVRTLDEKPVLYYYIGTFVMEREALAYIPENLLAWPDGQGLVAFLKIMIAMNQLVTFLHEGPDITFNTIEELSAAKESYLKFHTHFQ
jgi:glucose-1-phosphate cytidylyltransferase